MKVLLVTNMYPCAKKPYYGIFVKEQEEAIKRHHHDVEYNIYFIQGGGDDGKYSKSIKNYIKSIWKIGRKLKEENYDLVHVHYGFSGLFLLNPFRKKTPAIITLHGGDIQVEQGKKLQVWFTKQILKRAVCAVTLNDRMDNIVKKYARKTVEIPCSVNTDFFCSKDRGAMKDKDEITVIFPGDKTRNVKNYPLFSKVVKRFYEKYNIKVVEKEMNNLSREQVKALLQHSDMMLMTSFSEGSPQAVKEALSCNLPVVSTNVGDVAHVLDGVKGCACVDSFDSEKIADAMYRCFSENIDGVSGREKLKLMGLDDHSVADKLYSLYNLIISEK